MQGKPYIFQPTACFKCFAIYQQSSLLHVYLGVCLILFCEAYFLSNCMRLQHKANGCINHCNVGASSLQFPPHHFVNVSIQELEWVNSMILYHLIISEINGCLKG